MSKWNISSRNFFNLEHWWYSTSSHPILLSKALWYLAAVSPPLFLLYMSRESGPCGNQWTMTLNIWLFSGGLKIWTVSQIDSKSAKEVLRLKQSEEGDVCQRHDCVRIWLQNLLRPSFESQTSEESPDLIVQTFSGAHVWKQLWFYEACSRGANH